jgi:hypothetical protein
MGYWYSEPFQALVSSDTQILVHTQAYSYGARLS